MPGIELLLREYDRARAYTDDLWRDLTAEEVVWRPHENFSAIGWHLGQQAHVAHFMVRNLTAAEPSSDPALDAVMDSATPEPGRGGLPDLGWMAAFRQNAARSVHRRIGDIRDGKVGAPAQLSVVAKVVMAAVINHEYQHHHPEAFWNPLLQRHPNGASLIAAVALAAEARTTMPAFFVPSPARRRPLTSAATRSATAGSSLSRRGRSRSASPDSASAQSISASLRND
jgi:hypothetical protein